VREVEFLEDLLMMAELETISMPARKRLAVVVHPSGPAEDAATVQHEDGADGGGDDGGKSERFRRLRLS
jgi:hypothetical protein